MEKNNVMAGQTPRVKVLKINDKGAGVLLQNVRLTFVSLDKPSQPPGSDKANYSVTAIIPARDFPGVKKEFTKIFEQILKISKTLGTEQQRLGAIKAALNDGQDYSFFKIGNNQKDKTGKVYPGLANAYTLAAKQLAKPTESGFRPSFDLVFVDRDNQPIPAHSIRSEFYNGCWADLHLTLSPYEFMKKCSIKAYLNGVQKIADDERLGASNPFAVRDDLPVMGHAEDTEPDFNFSEPAKGKKKK